MANIIFKQPSYCKKKTYYCLFKCDIWQKIFYVKEIAKLHEDTYLMNYMFQTI